MPEITCETVSNHVRLLTMNRPETLNSLSPEGAQMQRQALQECAPMSTRFTKELVARTLHMPVRDALQFPFLFNQRLRTIAPEDALEGPRAFTERGKPQWSAVEAAERDSYLQNYPSTGQWKRDRSRKPHVRHRAVLVHLPSGRRSLAC